MDKVKLLDLEKRTIENIDFTQAEFNFNRLNYINYYDIDSWNREVNNVLTKIEIDLAYATTYNNFISIYELAEYKRYSHTICIIHSLISLKDKLAFVLLEVLYKKIGNYHIIKFSDDDLWEKLNLFTLDKKLNALNDLKYSKDIEMIQRIIELIKNLYKKFI